ncbi:MAG: hypothetical protein ACNS64_10850 [Candidatus Halalkalibacterium sp. M3_1C_030]
MADYLLLFGLLVIILFMAGVFFSITEFREMADHPDEYRRQDNTRIDIKKNN